MGIYIGQNSLSYGLMIFASHTSIKFFKITLSCRGNPGASLEFALETELKGSGGG